MSTPTHGFDAPLDVWVSRETPHTCRMGALDSLKNLRRGPASNLMHSKNEAYERVRRTLFLCTASVEVRRLRFDSRGSTVEVNYWGGSLLGRERDHTKSIR